MSRIEWVTSPERFAELEGPWDALAARHEMPFGRHAWMRAWWLGFAEGRSLRTCLLWHGHELAGAFPLVASRGRLEAMANFHTPVYTPLARDERALAELADAVLAERAELVVRAIPAEAPELAALEAAARRARRPWELEDDHTSPIVDTAGEWEDYRARMKPKWREIDRRRRKLEREHEVAYRLVEAPADLESELQAAFEIEGSGWKGRQGTSILAAEGTTRFYRELARAFNAAGEFRLSGLDVDGRLVAADICLIDERRLYLLKTGYDESLRKLGPGMSLRQAVIERCFELGLETHELLGDAMDWKLSFATEMREHRVFHSWPRTPAGLARQRWRRARPRLAALRDRVRRSVRR